MALKRPVFVLVLALILGEVMAVFKAPIFILFIMVPLFAVQKIIAKKWSAICVMIFLFGLAGYKIAETQCSLSEKLYELQGKSVEVSGIYDKGEESQFGYLYYLKNTTLKYGNNKINSKNILVYTQESENFKPGNTICVKGKVKKWEKVGNYGNFDGKKYYRSLGIYVAIEMQQQNAVNEKVNPVKMLSQNVKELLKKKLNKLCSDKNKMPFKVLNSENKAIFCAAILGDKKELPDEIKQLYQCNGISHLLAISGLHIATLGMFVYRLFRRKTKFLISGIVSMAVVAGFVIMSGMGISSIRAFGMFAFFLAAQIIGRKYDALCAVSFVLMYVSVQNPFIIFNAAFQMSFGAVIAIFCVYPLFRDFFGLDRIEKITKKDIKKKKSIKEKCILSLRKNYQAVVHSLLFSMSIQMVLMPVMLYNYFEFAPYSVLLNIIVIPLMQIVLVSAMAGLFTSVILQAVPVLGAALNGVIIYISKIMMLPACLVLCLYKLLGRIFIGFPNSVIVTGKPKITQIIIYYTVLVIISLILAIKLEKQRIKEATEPEKISPMGERIFVRKKKDVIKQLLGKTFKTVAFVMCFALMTFGLTFRNNGKMSIVFYDVGQGDGIIINKDGFTVMIDGGSTDVKKVGEYRLKPGLKARGIGTIDYAIITHGDNDHISGVMQMMEDESYDKVTIKNIMLPDVGMDDDSLKKIETSAKKNKVNVLYISKGDFIKKGNLNIACLHPKNKYVTNDRNSYSTVLDVSYGDFKMLLTGDLPENEEKTIENGLNEEYSVLKVAHHGSKYSSSKDFVKKVNPKLSIISCGENNNYGHPHNEALLRLENAGSKVYRTDRSGQIIISTDGAGMWVETFKK